MAAPMATRDESRSTLFVRNLPYSATKEQVENVFSEIGPVKKSFVVTEKGVKEKCRGFGYVTFALREDAEKALKARLHLDNRKLFISYSRRKEPKKGQRGKKRGDDEMEEEASQDDDGSKRTAAAAAEERTHEEDDVRPPHQTAASGPKGGGRRGRIAEGKTAASPEKPRPSKGGTEDKMGRLIIRNLAFNCSEKRLRKAFARFGDIAEVHIPCDPKDPKKVRGYGFVQFSNVESAGKAVKEMNAQEIMGRPIAVDWSLSRNRYLAAAKKSTPSKMEPQVEEGVGEHSESDSSEEDDSDEESGVESSSEMEETREGEEDDNEAEEDSEEDDSDDDDSSDDGEDDEDSDGEDASSSEDEGVASNEDKTKKGTPKPGPKVAASKKVTSDVDQGRTVFIRNVLFETTEEEIHKLFNQFGEIMYCKLVVDKATEHSKGAAFVQFATKEAADRCLEKAKYTHEGEDGLVLGGRQLLVSLALQREEASKLREVRKEKRKAEKKDKRNMYLLQEGFIRPGTKAAQGMTDADLAKRTKMESIKRLKLNNINIFVSPTRLAIHNLPKAVDQRRLKEVLLKAAGDKKARVIECRVMRDMKTPSADGQGKSLGFAFAEFTEHEHALAALRSLNNSTEYFGEAKRPIVGFSLENRLALEAKQRRQEKSLLKSRQIQSLQKSKEGRPGKGSAEQSNSKTRQQQLPKSGQKKKGAGGSVLPPPPSTKLERRLQSKSKVTVHLGAKKRWRDRGKEADIQRDKRRAKRRQLLAESGRKEREPAKPKPKQGEAQSSRRQKKKGDGEDIKFDKLVASYKHKLFSREESGRALKKSKWFEEG